MKRIKVKVENTVKRGPGRPRKIRPEEQYVSNNVIVNLNFYNYFNYFKVIN